MRNLSSHRDPSIPPRATSRVLLVDDHAIVRRGLSQLISGEPGLTVCGEAGDVSGALGAIEDLRPDLVVLDLSLGEGNGLELVKNLRALEPGLPVLVLSMHPEDLYAELVLQAGARGYLGKHEAADAVICAIRRILGGGVYLSERMTGKLLGRHVGARPVVAIPETPQARLSTREREVFQLIGQWHSTRQVARELSLSIKTVEFYRDQIRRKLGLENGADLVRCATEWLALGGRT